MDSFEFGEFHPGRRYRDERGRLEHSLLLHGCFSQPVAATSVKCFLITFFIPNCFELFLLSMDLNSYFLILKNSFSSDSRLLVVRSIQRIYQRCKYLWLLLWTFDHRFAISLLLFVIINFVIINNRFEIHF